MKIKQILLFTMCLGFSKFPSADGNLWAQNFTGSYSMHIEDSATKKSVDLKITFKKEKSCLEIITGENEGKFKTIFDEHEKTMTILTDKEGGSKMAMILNMPDKVESSEQITSNANITITDETKIIENYSCKKIIVESADAVTEMWMTEDLRITYTDMLTMLNRGGGPISGMIPKLKNYKELKGFPLKMIVTEKTKARRVTNISIGNILLNSIDNSVFNNSGYQVMDIRNVIRK